MAKINSSSDVTPTRPLSKKQTSSVASSTSQRSILGFFSKTTPGGPELVLKGGQSSSISVDCNSISNSSRSYKKPYFSKTRSQNVTPIPSSDAVQPPSSLEGADEESTHKVGKSSPTVEFSSPSRKGRKPISYAELSDDDEDVISIQVSRRRLANRRKLILDNEDDGGNADLSAMRTNDVTDGEDDEMDDFIVSDDSDAPVTKKRKRSSVSVNKARKRSNVSPAAKEEMENLELKLPDPATTQKWKYDPDNVQPLQPRPANVVKMPKASDKKHKDKAHKTEPEARFPWLANIKDMEGNSPGDPDYDHRTVLIPQAAWNKFSPFERQYWEIKQKFWDTIVFFKKGKFYELYENDATIGHQEFNLKLTDRVNMRMVGVPESSLDHWANQFVAKGYKIARVDQMESALGKEMREREGSIGANSKTKDSKIISRELSCVLTKGTLVEGSMLENDFATYCVAIKESLIDDVPGFGIAFVDTATGQFFFSEFIDSADLTKFETFVAQTRPQELLLEKSCISVRALRILKNNTSPTTIWNYLKPGNEFWFAETTRRELQCTGYFASDTENNEVWPGVLNVVKDKDLLMSAFGALIQYLRTLMLDQNLLTQKNFTLYDPIQKTNTLILDGKTLINLEVFANSFDGGPEGTLFALLNRCVTPFGKRMFRQWVCHPLAELERINERLDAVDMLNADHTMREQFTSQMAKIPDLERLISRIHAGVCKPESFVGVLEGFEQIEHTISLIRASGKRTGVIGRLLAAMPDLKKPLEYWQCAFNRLKAKEEKILIPESGIEEDYDASQNRIDEIKSELRSLLQTQRRALNSQAIQFKDVGKEIYQLEVPAKVKGVPSSWTKMSSTKEVRRYYFPALKALIRELQEAQETHSQIIKATSSRFFARFDQDYDAWLAAVKIIAQFDCLISLAKTSSALPQPRCRPVFVDDARSVIEFQELRHPCVPNVIDFIPNDIRLGGDEANINLLTGANAAGKSTVLRMTCVAVIMAQLGCYIPCASARLTPVDRIMSRLGANDNIFAAQSTFFVELSETKKILSEATARSLVILDELGRGTSSYDGVAVAEAVLYHIATHIGCIGFFATHYHSIASEFSRHPEVSAKRMQIQVDENNKRVTFLYKLEDGVAEGSFGMHCAAMCGIPKKVIDIAEVAAKEWEYTSRLKESLEKAQSACYVPLGVQSDVAWLLRKELGARFEENAMRILIKTIENL